MLLFNPFSEACASAESLPAHHPAALADEYVLSTEGLIWHGLSNQMGAAVWGFDQFNNLNLVVALHLLRRLDLAARGSPVAVSRALTLAIEADMCYGKWGKGPYTSGRADGGYKCGKSGPAACTDPADWKSTTELSEQFWARHLRGESSTKVQYCQCFVYAGVMTTMGRSLGLATRPVTTYRSAHDTNGDKAISDFYWYDETENGAPAWDQLTWGDLCNSKHHAKKCERGGGGKCGDNPNPACWRAISTGEGVDAACGAEHHCADCIPCVSGSDSVWEFHVWNDVWMARPDLGGAKAGGWQALDATPQELSDGENQMGPASVDLIASAVDERCYDGQFVLSEVNADTKYYLIKGETKKAAAEARPLVYAEHSETNMYYQGKKFPAGQNPWNKFQSVGYQVVTKKVGAISGSCRDDTGRCGSHKHDITYAGKARKGKDATGYRKKRKGPGLPMEEHEVDTAACKYGSDSQGAAMKEMRFPVEEATLRSNGVGGARKRGLDEVGSDTEESEEWQPPPPQRMKAGGLRAPPTGYGNGDGDGDDAGAWVPEEQQATPESGGVAFTFSDTNAQPVVVGQDHTLSVDLTNTGGAEKEVSVGFTGVAIDTRGVPLVRMSLRSGKDVPFRVIMKGEQTHWKTLQKVAPGATETVALRVPTVGKGWGIHGDSNALVRWVISVIVMGAEEAAIGGPPPIYKVVTPLVGKGDAMDVDGGSGMGGTDKNVV